MVLLAMLVTLPWLAEAQAPLDEDSPWPRVRSTNGQTVTLHLPQVEGWTSNWFRARAAVEVKSAAAKTNGMGVVWFEAHGRVDHSNRVVTLERIEVTRGRFPGTADEGSNALAIVRQVLPSGARTVSLDYLSTALGFAQAAARQGASGLKHDPPEILWVTNRTVLVVVDGEPIRRPIDGTGLERVVNTPALLVVDKTTGRFYLAGADEWFTANSLDGPWALTQNPPAEVAALSPAIKPGGAGRGGEPLPRIVVRTAPAELLVTSGLPDFRPIRGTRLQYAADSDNQLFFYTADREAYLLLSGRWFKSESLKGPWRSVAARDLPGDFGRIPPGSPQAIVLASVPNTSQAELALLANSVPTIATVNRQSAKIELSYDGEPQFKAISGTALRYAINARLPVIQTGETYYAVDNAVWFVAKSATGPWEVATEVPEEIYTIPPGSPVYYATFARVYQASDTEVEVGYTPGYTGAYEEDGTVVYGTGWDYEDWSGNDYYSWGWTWGYGYVYVPWYQWWVWRPWWSPTGGLRAALIDNIYDRWQGRSGVVHYDRPVGANPGRPALTGFSGHPRSLWALLVFVSLYSAGLAIEHVGHQPLFSSANGSSTRRHPPGRASPFRGAPCPGRWARPLCLTRRERLPAQAGRMVPKAGGRGLEFLWPGARGDRARPGDWGARGTVRRGWDRIPAGGGGGGNVWPRPSAGQSRAGCGR